MSTEKKPPFLVQAVYSFKGQNNDELCFKKHDVITVTQVEEGGWWEGTLKDKTGWFPSNYVKDYVPADLGTGCAVNLLSKSSTDLLTQQCANRTVIIKDLVDSEKAHVTELENLVNKFLVPINCYGTLNREDYNGLVSNIAEIVEVHQNLVKNLVDCSNSPPDQLRVGRVFLSSAARVKRVHERYCSTHPRAIVILEKYREELNKLMEVNGASPPGILVLVAGLSKPFRRLDKYSGILQELKRYMEEGHVDRGDVSRSISVYKDIATICASIRRQKELELQILNGGVQGWEGDELSTLGEILRIGSVAIGPELKDRYLVLFSSTLLILSVSNTLTSFIYEGKLPLTGIRVTEVENSEDSYKNAFEIKGSMIEEITAICQTKEDQQAWIHDINKQITIAKQSSSSSASSMKSLATVFSPSPPTEVVPKPPPHAVSSIPYIHLTMYFARLVRKRVITRKMLKKLLYKEYINRYDTKIVPRRRVHRSEYVIFAEKASLTWISSSSNSSMMDDKQYIVKPTKDEERMSCCSNMSVGTDGESMGSESNSSFNYIEKPIFRTTLMMDQDKNNVSCGSELKYTPNLICEDLSKIDDFVEMRYKLSNERNFQLEIRQSEPPPFRYTPIVDLHSELKSFSANCENIRSTMLPAIYDHDLRNRVSTKHKILPSEKRYCSSYNIASPNVSSTEELEKLIRNHHFPTNSAATDFSNSKIMPELGNANNERQSGSDYSTQQDKISLRSSDSGLADITSLLVNTPTSGALNIESDESSNFENHCMCTSPFDTTPHTSTTEDKVFTAERKADTGLDDEPLIFKSEMYAHWWLKTKIPANALKTPAASLFSEKTGKSKNIHVYACYSCVLRDTNLGIPTPINVFQ